MQIRWPFRISSHHPFIFRKFSAKILIVKRLQRIQHRLLMEFFFAKRQKLSHIFQILFFRHIPTIFEVNHGQQILVIGLNSLIKMIELFLWIRPRNEVMITAYFEAIFLGVKQVVHVFFIPQRGTFGGFHIHKFELVIVPGSHFCPVDFSLMFGHVDSIGIAFRMRRSYLLGMLIRRRIRGVRFQRINRSKQGFSIMRIERVCASPENQKN